MKVWRAHSPRVLRLPPWMDGWRVKAMVFMERGWHDVGHGHLMRGSM